MSAKVYELIIKIYALFLREDLGVILWEKLNGIVLYGQIVTYSCRPLAVK